MANRRSNAHTVRIVGGSWKRTPLAVPDLEGLRPTPDRVRETLFNWLGDSVRGSACLDLFAGTGALGLEAASRGAGEVWLVENARAAAQSIERTIARLEGAAAAVRLVRSDALEALRVAQSAGRRFDLVFLDPPFGAGWLERVAPCLGPVLTARAQVYVEAPGARDAEQLAGALGRPCAVVGSGRAGQVFYHLLHCSGPTEG